MLIALLYFKNKLNFCFVKYEEKQKQPKKKQKNKRKKRFFTSLSNPYWLMIVVQ